MVLSSCANCPEMHSQESQSIFHFFRVLVEIMVDLFQHVTSYLDGFLVPAVNRGGHCSVIAYVAKRFEVYIPVYDSLTDYQVLMNAIRSPTRGAGK